MQLRCSVSVYCHECVNKSDISSINGIVVIYDMFGELSPERRIRKYWAYQRRSNVVSGGSECSYGVQ